MIAYIEKLLLSFNRLILSYGLIDLLKLNAAFLEMIILNNIPKVII